MGKITPHFEREEFACKDGCGFDDVDLRLVGVLELLRTIINAEIVITSGCRCENHNREVGGKPESYHLGGGAADFTMSNKFDLAEAFGLLCNWSGGVHIYEDRNFIHLDMGLKRRW